MPCRFRRWRGPSPACGESRTRHIPAQAERCTPAQATTIGSPAMPPLTSQIYSSTPTTRSTPSPPRSSHHPLGARTQRLWCRTSSSLIASFKKLRIGQVRTAARTQQRQSTVAGSTPKYPLPPLLAIAASTLATS